jgi:hypothetical protein
VRRVLFDEDVPRLLRRDLPDFQVVTVVEAGWSGVKNGELLRRAEAEFDVFVTADRNLPFQQNVARLSLGIVVLAAGSTKINDLRPLAPELSAAIQAVEPGQLLYVPRERSR